MMPGSVWACMTSRSPEVTAVPSMFYRTLVDRCTIYRSERSYDADGQPVAGQPLAVEELTNRKCRLIKHRRWVYDTDTAMGAWIEQYRLATEADVEILKDDLVEIDGVRYKLVSGLPRREHHMTYELERLGGS